MRRLPVRWKLLLLLATMLLASVGTFLAIATRLFTADKLAYVYDLQSSLVGSLAEQTRATLQNHADRARALGDGSSRDFSHAPEFVRVRVFERTGDGAFTLQRTLFNEEAMERAGIEREDLAVLDRERAIPLDAVARQPGEIYVQNSSIAPDLPLIGLAVVQGGRIVVAEANSESLLRLFARSRVHRTFLVNAVGEVLAHPDPAQVVGRSDLSSHPLVTAALRTGASRSVQEYTAKDGSVHLGAFSAVGVGGLIALTETPQSQALSASRELIRRTAMLAIAILLGTFAVAIYFSRAVTEPLRNLNAAAEAIGRGNFAVRVPSPGTDEIGELGATFNRMAGDLERAQAQLAESAKLAAFGQIGAGITHEVRNPLTGILSFAQIARAKSNDKERVQELLALIEKEATRCNEILANFLQFARPGQAQAVHVPLDPNAVVASASKIVGHQLSVHGVKLVLETTPDLPAIAGNEGELTQVLVNLAINAQQAITEARTAAGMEAGGCVWMRTLRGDRGGVLVEVEDDGPGMPEDVKQRIFEPFFTTKPSGKGTGLGLSVSQSIVSSHDGMMTVDSKPGRGTRFRIVFPAAAGAVGAAAPSARG